MSTLYVFKVNGEGEQEISSVNIIHGNMCSHAFTVRRSTREIVVKENDDGSKECLVNGEVIGRRASRVTFVDSKGSAFYYPQAVHLEKIEEIYKTDFVHYWNRVASEAGLKPGDLITIDPYEDNQWVKDCYFEVDEVTDTNFVVHFAGNSDSGWIVFPLTRTVSNVSRNSIVARMLGYKPTAEELKEELELVAGLLREIRTL